LAPAAEALALKAAVEAYVAACPAEISLKGLRTAVAMRLGLPAGGLDARQHEVKALAVDFIMARAASARAAALVAHAPGGGGDID
jgi:hypothetical protein